MVYHEGYLNYLASAWCNHYSIVLRPDDIWYIILNEPTSIISKTPNEYASLFTTTQDKKQEISVSTDNVETIDPDLVIYELKKYVPSDIDSFIPTFSTSTIMSKLAMNVSFCDMVSPYYSYSTFLCGIPNIRIEGEIDDWKIIVKQLNVLSSLFPDNIKKYLSKCLFEIGNIIEAIITDDVNYFEKIVKLNPCGSGHEFSMNGWILNFLNRNNSNSIQLEGLPPHFSNMKYTNLETKRKFILYCGLFYSKIEDEFLIPEYNAFRIEITNIK